jgi:proliferating cell nuclear antigen
MVSETTKTASVPTAGHFLARTASPAEWKAVTATIQTLVEEATFDISGEGITFRAMDPSHVALVDLFWPNGDFQKFECEKAERFTVRMEDFAKLIRRAEAKDSIELSRAGPDSLSLKITNGYRREFELHLIESAQGNTPLPKLNYNAKFTTLESAFDRILNDVSAISNHITIEASKDKIVFTGKGDTGKAAVSLEKGGPDVQELEVKEESKATYSIEYLLRITKAAGSASDSISFEYSSKMPLRMAFTLGDSTKGGRIHFYLAPRVSE